MGARLMGFYLTIEQGDHLPRIADENGFSDWHTIWDDPNNASLRAQRQDPGVLAPGDRLLKRVEFIVIEEFHRALP